MGVLIAFSLGVPASELLLAKLPLLLLFFPLVSFLLAKTLINEPDLTCRVSSESGEVLCPLVTCEDDVVAAVDLLLAKLNATRDWDLGRLHRWRVTSSGDVTRGSGSTMESQSRSIAHDSKFGLELD